jgi:hypothetical protein
MSDETPRPDTDGLAFWRANLLAILEAQSRSLAAEPRRQEGPTEVTTGECLPALVISLILVGAGVVLVCSFATEMLAPGVHHVTAPIIFSILAVCVADLGLGVLELRRRYRLRRQQRGRNV